MTCPCNHPSLDNDAVEVEETTKALVCRPKEAFLLVIAILAKIEPEVLSCLRISGRLAGTGSKGLGEVMVGIQSFVLHGAESHVVGGINIVGFCPLTLGTAEPVGSTIVAVVRECGFFAV